MAVHADPLAQISDFICKAHLEGMERVVTILDYLRHPNRGANDRGLDARIQLQEGLAAPGSLFPDHNLGGVIEVVYRASLTQKLRVVAHVETLTEALAGMTFQDWNQEIVGATR